MHHTRFRCRPGLLRFAPRAGSSLDSDALASYRSLRKGIGFTERGRICESVKQTAERLSL
jgi:hypothetical protein